MMDAVLQSAIMYKLIKCEERVSNDRQ